MDWPSGKAPAARTGKNLPPAPLQSHQLSQRTRITTASSTVPDDRTLIEFARSHGISEGVLKLISGTAASSNPGPRRPLDMAPPAAIQTAGLKPKAVVPPSAPTAYADSSAAPEALPGSLAVAAQLAPAQTMAAGAATAKGLSLTDAADKQAAAQPDSAAVLGLPPVPTAVPAASSEADAPAINAARTPPPPPEQSALQAKSIPGGVPGNLPGLTPSISKAALSAATAAQPEAAAADSASLMAPAAAALESSRLAPAGLNGAPAAGAATAAQRQVPLQTVFSAAAISAPPAPELAAPPLSPPAGNTAAIPPGTFIFAHAGAADAVDAAKAPQQQQTALQTALPAEADATALTPQPAANPPAPPASDDAVIQPSILQMNQPELFMALRSRKEPAAPFDQLNEPLFAAPDVATAAIDMTHPATNYAGASTPNQHGATAGQPKAESLQESYFRNVEQMQLLSTRVGEAVGERMAVMIGRGVWQLDLQLNPVHLGRIDIQLAMSGSGKLDADIKTSRQQTVDLLLGGQSRLKETLSQSGFDLTRLNVEQDSSFAQSGQPQSDRQPSSSRGNAALLSPTSSAPGEPQAGDRNSPANTIGLDWLDVTV